jgi:CheY-like chemotaxis protein
MTMFTSRNSGNVIDLRRDANSIEAPVSQKVVIVNGNPDMLELVETVLDAGHYDVVFVESNAHAYTEIKRVQPNLIILCLQFDQADGFRILTMLKLDEDTREIPVVTYTTEYGEREEPEAPEPSENEMFALKLAPRMN